MCVLAICLGVVPARAAGVEIAPDPALHMPQTRTLTVGSGASANVWRVFEANKAHYKKDGRIVWLVSPLKNPIPKGNRGEARWYRDQVRGLLKALGLPTPKKISVSTEFARSSVVADQTPFRANLYVQFPDGQEIVDVIYVETITKGAGPRRHAIADERAPGAGGRIGFRQALGRKTERPDGRRLEVKAGAGEGNRTLVCSLGSCRSTIELRPRRGGP